MMIQINAVTTSVIINVTTVLIATAAPVESSSSDSSSTGYIKIKISMNHLFAFDRLMYVKFLMLAYVRAAYIRS